MAADAIEPRVFGAARAHTQAPEQPEAAQVPELGAVCEENLDYVFRCLRALGVRGDGLDDAVQDVFVVVQDKLGAFDGRAQLRTWLYAIVLRVARRYRERAAIDQRRFVAEEPPERAAASGGLEHSERLAQAQQALAALDDDKREVFVLAQIEQMSAPEIAAVLGVPVNTVYSRLRAARIAFAEHVARGARTAAARRSR